jgi:hypothetical protein
MLHSVDIIRARLQASLVVVPIGVPIPSALLEYSFVDAVFEPPIETTR